MAKYNTGHTNSKKQPMQFRQNRLTLAFEDSKLEREYLAAIMPRTRFQGGLAVATGIPIYLGMGALDLLFVPANYHAQLWAVRICAVLLALCLYAIARSPRTSIHTTHILLALVGFDAGMTLIAIFTIVPADVAFLYYGGIILATFYTYNLSGTRFIWALWVDVVLVAVYNLIFVVWKEYPTPQLLVHDFFMISSNMVGGAAGYWSEFQSRRLFLRERELEQERERHLFRALHDPLTNLGNRDLLSDRITQALAHSQRDQHLGHTLFFIDLDRFKTVNDELGHDVGDSVLKAVASRLLVHTRETDTVARLGGDEFVILAYGMSSIEEAKNFGDRCKTALEQPIISIPPHLSVGASIGVCTFPYEGATVSDLLRRADQAMYEAKRDGRSNRSEGV
jgi:diguanylate cyclase